MLLVILPGTLTPLELSLLFFHVLFDLPLEGVELNCFIVGRFRSIRLGFLHSEPRAFHVKGYGAGRFLLLVVGDLISPIVNSQLGRFLAALLSWQCEKPEPRDISPILLLLLLVHLT